MIMPLQVYDTNNWARIRFEADSTGLPLRGLFNGAFYSPAPALYVFDGKNAKALRRKQYPNYKIKRVSASDNFYLMLGFFKELLLHTGNVVVEVPGYEADDVIATFCKANPEIEIEIQSTDRDFCALCRPGLTTPKANLKGVTPEEVRLYKTLVGDTGDSIPGLVKFGEGAWLKLTPEHKANWAKHLQEGLEFDPSHLGLSKPVHIKNFQESNGLLRVYWSIIGFFDVPQDLIAKHTRVGTPDFNLANSKLKELLQ